MGYVLEAVTSRGETMILGTAIVLALGMSIVIAGVLAVAGRQTRQEEEVAARTASSRQAA
jgi:hypothetical protein